MALRIRLARGGAKKRPFYKLVVTENTNPRDGKFLERLGTYNPLLPKDHHESMMIDVERVKYWMSVGAKVSDRVEKLLASLNVVEKPAIVDTPLKSAPKKKAQERTKVAAEATKAAAAAAVEAEAAKHHEEAPTVEVEAAGEPDAPTAS
jgi:small subunit ribosomal protein S16